MKLKHLFTAIIGSLMLVSFLSCSKSNGSNSTTPPGGGGGNTTTISVYGMAFPASTTVKVGTVVKWMNNDGYTHTVTSDDGTSFNSGNLSAGSTFSYTASTIGSFNYHCNIHANMHGTLVVTN